MVVKVNVEKIATIALFALLLFCLASATFILARCQPIERDIEIDCRWKGAPVSANLKWTEPKEDPVTLTNTDDGSKSKSGTSSQASMAINAQQALMLTGASAGAALAGGGLLVKKKLDGGSSSEQEAKQTTSTSTINKELLMQKQMKSQSSSLQSQPPTQTQQSSIQNPPKDNGLTTTASTLTASGATITKDLLMQKQMDSLNQEPKQSQPDVQKPETDVAASTLTSVSTATITRELLMQKQMDSLTKQSTQADGNPQPKETSSSTSISQGTGLLASSYSAAQIAAEMWPQRQKEFERLAKQMADLAAKFSIPSYTSTGLSLASSMTNAAGNAWAKLQGFGSAIGNGIDRAVASIKPYTKSIAAVALIAIIFVSMLFTCGATAPATPAILTGVSLSQGAGLLGAGIVAGGITLYATHNIIMNYPKQPSFETEHTQIIEKPTSKIKDEKGSGTYGEDVAQEQLEQAEIRKDTIIQYESDDHELSRGLAKRTLEEQWGQKQIDKNKRDTGYDKRIGFYNGQPDLTSEDYIVECKSGMEESYDFDHIKDQGTKYPIMAEKSGKKLIFWFLRRPSPENPDQNKLIGIINWLIENGITVLYAEDYYELEG